MRSTYWSCTKFADWLRGTEKLSAATSEEWNEWHTSAKMRHSFRYWLAEEALDAIQGFLYYPVDCLNDIRYYINNRWISRSHSLTAHPKDIKPGSWADVGNRFLPCLFNELVNFVEIELAWWHIAWDDEARKKFQAPWYARGWFRWRTWRCKRAGLENLAWQMKLTHGDGDGVGEDHKLYGKPTPQAKAAKEVYDLYFWWTVTRPRRPDPYEVSGWTAICEQAREINGGRLSFQTPPELKKEHDRAHKQLMKMEAEYEAEDEAMLISLIKVRNSLWT